MNGDSPISKINQGPMELEKKQQACTLCNKSFTLKKNLLKHLRRFHNATTEANVLTVRKMRCSLSSCSYTCRRMEELRGHIASEHYINLLVDSLQFPCNDEFKNWKKEEEARSLASFVSIRQKGLLKNGGMRQTLVCHRSGHYIPKGGGKYRLKSLGSRKTGRACPAAIHITHNPSGPLTVLYHKTHVGHGQELEFLSLTKEERQHLSESIEKGFSLNSILEGIKESQKLSKQTDCRKRIHLLSRKDLHNIARAFRNGATKKKDKMVEPPETSMKACTDNCTLHASSGFLVCPSNQLQPSNLVQTVIAPSELSERQQQQVMLVSTSMPEVFIMPQPSMQSSPLPGNDRVSSQLENPVYSLNQSILTRLDKLSQTAYKADYLTPKQFALLIARLDAAVEVLDGVADTTAKRKCGKNTSTAQTYSHPQPSAFYSGHNAL